MSQLYDIVKESSPCVWTMTAMTVTRVFRTSLNRKFISPFVQDAKQENDLSPHPITFVEAHENED